MDRQPIFYTETERLRYLEILTASLKKYKASLLSYCLMPNHLHHLLRASVTPIWVPLQEAFGHYSSYFNFMHGRTGHLFEGRHHSELCKSDRQLVNTVAYIHMNPVSAGLVEHPKDWRWSSHNELMEDKPVWTDLSLLSESTGITPDELRRLYSEAIDTELSRTDKTDLERILAAVCASNGVSPGEIRTGRRGGPYTRTRIEFLLRAEKDGYSDSAIAKTLGCTKGAISLLRRSLVVPDPN